MNEEKEPEEEHEDDGDYEAESSPTKRGVKGRGRVRVGRPKKVRVTPPPPTAVTATTTTAPPMNVVSGAEDVKVKINNTVVPLCPSISASAEADDRFDEEDGDEETLMGGKENKEKRWEWDVDVPSGSSVLEISEKGGAAWKVYVGRNFSSGGPWTFPWIVFSLPQCSA